MITNYELLGNSLFAWLCALGLATASFFVLFFTAKLTRKYVPRYVPGPRPVRVAVTQVIRLNILFLLAISLIAGLSMLTLSPAVDGVLWKGFITALFVQLGLWGSGIAAALCIEVDPQTGMERARSAAYGLLSAISRMVIWLLVFLLILDNLGVNISALIAGLGIGGIAVALAVQNVLGDVLASLSILLDKPFEVGDFIVVGELMGSVERIGIKTTRLRSLSGEQLVLSNSSLLSGQIRNFKRMFERRMLFTFGVTYDTPRSVLEQLPKRVQEIVAQQPKTRFDRAHFKSFGDSALLFEVVYFILVPEMNTAMDIQQSINLELMRVCEELKVEFAFPTQTVQLQPVPLQLAVKNVS
jgi:small-conductance mechanosensitive channel